MGALTATSTGTPTKISDDDTAVSGQGNITSDIDTTLDTVVEATGIHVETALPWGVVLLLFVDRLMLARANKRAMKLTHYAIKWGREATHAANGTNGTSGIPRAPNPSPSD